MAANVTFMDSSNEELPRMIDRPMMPSGVFATIVDNDNYSYAELEELVEAGEIPEDLNDNEKKMVQKILWEQSETNKIVSDHGGMRVSNKPVVTGSQDITAFQAFYLVQLQNYLQKQMEVCSVHMQYCRKKWYRIALWASWNKTIKHYSVLQFYLKNLKEEMTALGNSELGEKVRYFNNKRKILWTIDQMMNDVNFWKQNSGDLVSNIFENSVNNRG